MFNFCIGGHLRKFWNSEMLLPLTNCFDVVVAVYMFLPLGGGGPLCAYPPPPNKSLDIGIQFCIYI